MSESRMNWKIRAIKWLVDRLRDEGEFGLRIGHSLVLNNPDPELYLEIVHGEDEVQLFDLTFEADTWSKIRNTMQDVAWRLEKEYEPVEGDG